MNKLMSVLSIFLLTFGGYVFADAASDQGLAQSVKARLMADPTVSSASIDVQVKDGTVTLSGTVNSTAQEQAAAQVAQSVSGVSRVQSNIVINSQPNPGVTSPGTAGAVPSNQNPYGGLQPSTQPAGGQRVNGQGGGQ